MIVLPQLQRLDRVVGHRLAVIAPSLDRCVCHYSCAQISALMPTSSKAYTVKRVYAVSLRNRILTAASMLFGIVPFAANLVSPQPLGHRRQSDRRPLAAPSLRSSEPGYCSGPSTSSSFAPPQCSSPPILTLGVCSSLRVPALI